MIKKCYGCVYEYWPNELRRWDDGEEYCPDCYRERVREAEEHRIMMREWLRDNPCLEHSFLRIVR